MDDRAATRAGPVLIVAICVFLPIVLIGLLNYFCADSLRLLVPMELSNFGATRAMLSSFLRDSGHGDSWLPMMHALDTLHGPHRNRLYETLFFDAHIRFQYPPTSLLPLDLLSWVGLLSIRALNAINSAAFVCNAIATGTLAWLLFRRPLSRPCPPPAAMAAIATAAAFLFYPAVRAHLLGQIQLWIDLLFISSIICWLLGYRLAAGLLIGLACTIKPQMGLLLLWGLVWREKRFVAGIVLGLLPPLSLSLYLYGYHNHVAYLDVLSFLSRHGEGYFANNSVNGILNWYFSSTDSLHWYDNSFTPFNPAVYAGTLAASGIALAAIVIPGLVRGERRASLPDFGAAAIFTVIGSPVAWEHHYGILLPLFLVAAHIAFQRSRGAAAFVALMISWTLVANFIPLTSLTNDSWAAASQAYCLAGALLLAILLMRGRMHGTLP